MEGFLIVLLIIIFFLLLNIKNSVSNKFKALQDKIDMLSAQLKKAGISQQTESKKSVLEDYNVRHAPVVTAEPEKEIPKVKNEIKDEEPAIVVPGVISPPPAPQHQRPPVARAPKPKKPGFFERNPDLEKFIGENLANKIGIGVLVLGIGFFVKYAIDQEWINEIGRVFIGILCGALLLGIAHKMRKSFAAFSSVLVGGGLAVLYLTIAIAFHDYHIFS
ncbi:MAG TPA: DUF2339 domain-containing protein, partial [Chryseolinea sp.]